MINDELMHEIRERYERCDAVLNERQRRHWAAVEALKLGHGGIAAISKLLRISPNTIRRGIRELASGQPDSFCGANPRVRMKGGGRKPTENSAETSAEPPDPC